MKALFGLASCVTLFLTGCGAPPEPWTREQQAAATTRSYPGLSASAAMRHAEAVIRATDPKSVRFEFTNDGFNATRPVFAFAIVTTIVGDYRYAVRVTPSGGGAIVEFRAWSNIGGTTTAAIDQGGAVFWDQKPLYDLFFARLDNLAGKRPDWISCADAKVSLGAPSHTLEPLCFAAQDIPASPTN